MITPFQDLLAEAQRNRYAVVYAESWDIYSLEAVLEAAEAESIPAILGFGGATVDVAWMERGGLERLGALGLVAARAAKVPVSLLLNEVSTLSLILRGLEAGFNAVMLDTSSLPFEENLRLTQKVVEAAHALGAGVEGELGVLPDASGEMNQSEGIETDPEQAARFVAETGIDALSVSVGNVHILTQGEAEIDCERLAQIHMRVAVPLVIHGGSGFPEAAIPEVISLGVAKVNIGTALKKAFLEGVAEAVHDLPLSPDFQKTMGSRKETDVLQHGKLRMRQEVVRRMRLWKPGAKIVRDRYDALRD
jgi:ketose-bisphosphate aldolase